MNLYTNGMGVFGEFGIFNVPFQIFEETGAPAGCKDSGEWKEEEVNYLQKGEKILSLLREKKQREPFVADNILEMVKARWELTLNALAKNIGSNLEKTFMNQISEDPDNYEVLLAACKELNAKLPKTVLILPEERDRQLTLASVLCKKAPKAVLKVAYGDEERMVPVGEEFKKSHERGCRLRGDGGKYIFPAHFKRLMGELYLRGYLLNTLRSLHGTSKSVEEYAQKRAIGKLQADFLGSGQNINVEFDYIREHQERYKCMYGAVIFYPSSEEAEHAVMKLGGHDIQNILEVLQDDYNKTKSEAKMEKELSGDYAKSYQTKKNIPQKYIRAMSRSGFNEYFGYVEFDEECDLALMDELYKEYQAIVKELGIAKYPEVSLRFRKLGNHKASGLYYYILKCMCVDVRFPGSMVHEVGHVIDYHMGHISAQYAFQGIYDRYEQLLKNYMNIASGPQAEILKGKTKYNLQYYLMPTEVFARCFEMYVVRIRKVDNSLCKPESGFAYPEDEKLEELIKDFYDGILRRKSGQEDVA